MRVINTTTGQEVYTADGSLQSRGCLSLLIKNEGVQTITLWNCLVIAPGDAPVSLPNNSFGNHICKRWDNIPFSFSGAGAKKMVVIKDSVLSITDIQGNPVASLETDDICN